MPRFPQGCPLGRFFMDQIRQALVASVSRSPLPR